jgi:DNA-binding NarL/FixJ family response regulator
MFFWDGDRYLGQFSQNRTREQGDFTDRELEILEALHPHFEVAIRRVMLFDNERSARSAVEESIRRSPLPTIVLDWELTPIYHNAAAAEASAAWRLDQEARSLKPVFELPEDVRDACDALRKGVGWTGRERDFEEWERILNHSSQAGSQVRLRVIAPEGSQMSKPRILAEFWSHPGDHGAGDQAVLLARLTPAERKVALCVGTGLDNDAIAGELGISRHTVRSHLRNIFEKLSVTNRTQLALKVRSSTEGRV